MPDAEPLRPGDPARLGAYRLSGRLGKGGQAVVYLGQDDTGGPVAVKHFHTGPDDDPEARADLMRELEAARRVARFCTAQVLDFGVAGERPYIVSEYVPGPSLHAVVTAEGPRSGSALDRLAVSTATALVALHDAGVVHRDLKPRNVLMGPDGPRVIDFGIARPLTGDGTVTHRVAGTPAYMAPEQFTAGELGVAVDVFAWAGTVVFAATGRPPFGTGSLPALVNRITHAEPDLGAVEPPLRDLLTECLAKTPAHRPTAQAILDHLLRGNRPPLTAEHPPTSASAPGGGASGGGAGGGGRFGGTRPAVGGRGMVLAGAAVVVAAGTAAVLLALAGGGPRAGVPGPAGTTAAGGTAVTTPSGPASTASPSERAELVELGPGRFTGFCKHLGWEWVEYRTEPRPGAYCVIRDGDRTRYLGREQRDAGCRWRYDRPDAVHRFKGRSNYCYR